MYAIYAYIDPPKPPQLIGIYGSPMAMRTRSFLLASLKAASHQSHLS